jgi:hypothetical protein
LQIAVDTLCFCVGVISGFLYVKHTKKHPIYITDKDLAKIQIQEYDKYEQQKATVLKLLEDTKDEVEKL